MKYARLKFDNKQQALDYLSKHFPAPDDSEQAYAPQSPSDVIVLVGELVDTPAVTDDEGNVITEVVMVDGYHVDIYAKRIPQLGKHGTKMQPNTPSHKLAGVDL